MEAKPIFICYLPVGDLDYDQSWEYISQIRETLSDEIVGWSLLLVPTRERVEPKFEVATANNLTDLQQEQLDSLRADLNKFLEPQLDEN